MFCDGVGVRFDFLFVLDGSLDALVALPNGDVDRCEYSDQRKRTDDDEYR